MYFLLLLSTFNLLTSLRQKKLSGFYVSFLWCVHHHQLSSASTMTDQVLSPCSYMSVLKWWIITSDRLKAGMGWVKGQEKRWKWQCRPLKAADLETGSNNKNLYIGNVIYLFFQEMWYHKLEAAHSARICGLCGFCQKFLTRGNHHFLLACVNGSN